MQVEDKIIFCRYPIVGFYSVDNLKKVKEIKSSITDMKLCSDILGLKILTKRPFANL